MHPLLLLGLPRTIYLMRSVLMFHMFIFSSSAVATSKQELRLFHEPSYVVSADAWLMHAIRMRAIASELRKLNNRQTVQKPDKKPSGQAMPPANVSDTQKNNVYKYNGFIATPSTQHYLINGMRLVDIDALELVSVKLGGRELVLKTPNGSTFELSVGQSINRNSL